MKPDQLPECQIDENDNHYICYVMTYDDEEHMYIDVRYKDGFEEVIKTCVFCGEMDISYPV
jgi:hypothetical protein|tara:strand:+ start:376 stop:558 length:183 start_codon:yes stop_codon:yes gene_type:complete